VVTVPFLRPVFELPSAPGQNWWHILPLALLPVTAIELTKLILAFLAGRNRPHSKNGFRDDVWS
jgi:hypothetical protein